MCDVSHDLKFWENGDNISLMVQDKKHSCNRTPIRNCMWPIEQHQCQWPWMTLKVPSAVGNLS